MESIIADLEVIASIQPGDKINSTTKPITLNRWFTGIYRYFYGGSYWETLDFLDKIFIKLKLSDVEIDNKLLERTILGLINLSYSYRDDINASEKIRNKISIIRDIIESKKNKVQITLRHSI